MKGAKNEATEDTNNNRGKADKAQVSRSTKNSSTQRRTVPSPLRSPASNIMTKPSPRISQRAGGACTPRKPVATPTITKTTTVVSYNNNSNYDKNANKSSVQSGLEQIPSSTRSSRSDVPDLSRSAMTPMAKPTNKTLFDTSHGYKPQRTGLFALSHFAPSTHPPSLMKKNTQSSSGNSNSTINCINTNGNQENNSVNTISKSKTQPQEESKLVKQPQSARRLVSTPRLTFRQAMTPHAQRLRSFNKNSVLIECEDGKVKDVFDISPTESK